MNSYFPEGTEIDLSIKQIAYWYDRGTQSWVVQSLNADGDQVGDADYCGTKAGRDWSIEARKVAAPAALVVWLRRAS